MTWKFWSIYLEVFYNKGNFNKMTAAMKKEIYNNKYKFPSNLLKARDNPTVKQ